MEMERYDLGKNPDDYIYEFYSEGPKGRIKKAIKFQRIEGMGGNLFNLSFGDFIELTGKIDSLVVSNNNDRNKILFTVAAAVQDFIVFWPKAIILIAGSTDSRTRLYQMGISLFWLEISVQYQIYGKLEDEWLPFERGINYEGFLLFRKID